MRSLKRFLPVILVSGLFAVSSCQKEADTITPPPDPGGGGTGSAADKIKDTALLYARDIYLWYDQIPASFNARSYADPDKIMVAIRNYSMEPGFANPVDQWSFGIDKDTWDDVSSGASQDFGFSVFFLAEGDLRVKYVEEESPAGQAGLRRGWRVSKINGSTNITTSNVDFIVDKIFNSSSTEFTFTKPDGSTEDITLNAGAYQTHPILLDSVYTAGSAKVGYLVFNSFLGDTTAIYNEFEQVFNSFAAENVNEVVVDLRYNGGGYVSVQEKLANYLVPSAGNGQVMMQQEFNNKYSQYNSTTNYSKIGSLNLNRIFFIVSNSTASASELLINNLDPYLDVKIVGPQPSYGKPVGYFPIPLGDWYIFPVSFRTTNKLGSGNYFGGLPLDKQTDDGLDKDWGDVNEASFASIMKYIGTGTFGFAGEIPGTRAGRVAKTENVIESNRELDATSFKGAIGTKRF